MEGEGYPKYRIFSVKRALWRDKKAHGWLTHVRKVRNLAVDVGEYLFSWHGRRAAPTLVVSMQRRRLHHATANFIRCRIAHGIDLYVVDDYFAGKRVIAVDGEFPVFDSRDPEYS